MVAAYPPKKNQEKTQGGNEHITSVDFSQVEL